MRAPKNRLILKPISSEQTTDSGLVIPEMEAGDVKKGTIVSDGTEAPHEGSVAHYPAGAAVPLMGGLVSVHAEAILAYE